MMNSLEKVADPYSKKHRCPTPDGFDCLDLEETYIKDERTNGNMQSKKEPTEWAGNTTELTITDPEHNAYAEIIKKYDRPSTDSAGAGEYNIDDDVEKEIIKIVETHSNRSAADHLVEYIRSKNIFPDVEGKVLRRISETYHNCIKSTQEENKKKLKKSKTDKLKFTEREAVNNLRKCTAYLQNVPGLVNLKSNEISERLRIQRETETKKYISSLVHAGEPPIRLPAKTIQIRVCSYTDDSDVLNKDHHLYVTVGEGKWVFNRGENGGHKRLVKSLEH